MDDEPHFQAETQSDETVDEQGSGHDQSVPVLSFSAQSLLSSRTTGAFTILQVQLLAVAGDLPNTTETVPAFHAHTDQVWIAEWSRYGNLLASVSTDKSVIIRECGIRNVLNHPYPVRSLAWSPDDTILLTGDMPTDRPSVRETRRKVVQCVSEEVRERERERGSTATTRAGSESDEGRCES
ncbi:hypothetical protein B0H17DRAFT_1140353 [Mycena rosella]|uniref:Uncharacterized protein n=1 Tax=Mycena rosella TaxID=1033263 RepID=A0AAD7G7U0_MYCRO|nr:hypothetical protein B0H17DRAFT_1140353 [Mycena rosella]